MDALKFLSEVDRICKLQIDCEECPLDVITGCDNCCNGLTTEKATKLVSFVEKWSAEHPVKTNLDYLKECFPNIILHKDMYLYVCTHALGLKNTIFKPHLCKHNTAFPKLACVECWNLPYEEDK